MPLVYLRKWAGRDAKEGFTVVTWKGGTGGAGGATFERVLSLALIQQRRLCLIQAQIIDHLKRLQEQSGMSILFITHDLGLVAEIADRVLVLYAGQIVELSDVEPLFDQPLMPYTGALMRSIPRPGCSSIPGYRIEAIPGTVPNAAALPHGCAFHPRCQFARSTVCDAQNPVLETYKSGRMVRCFRWEELREEGAI